MPLALAEAGLLDRFVTDFYAPENSLARLLPAFLRRWRVDGLARNRTLSVWGSFAVQVLARVLRVEGWRSFAVTDELLARASAQVAARSGAALYCYHSYVPRSVAAGAKLVIFAYHPRPATELVLLLTDADAHPEVAAAFARERATLEREPAIDWTRADAVVCASSFTAASLVADGCATAKITVIPYGSPIAPAILRCSREPNSPTEFLFVGQGIQRKGLHHLIRAWQANPPPDARLTIVAYRIDPDIAALIAHPTIRLLGYQSTEALAALFDAADVFVLPSLVEGFGLVYLEALAHGCHLIGTRNTGLPDLGLDDQAATLIKAGDVPALSQTLTDCAARASAGGFDRRAIAAQSIRRARADFRHAIAEHAAAVLEGNGLAT